MCGGIERFSYLVGYVFFCFFIVSVVSCLRFLFVFRILFLFVIIFGISSLCVSSIV